MYLVVTQPNGGIHIDYMNPPIKTLRERLWNCQLVCATIFDFYAILYSMPQIQIDAPAKLNLHLGIGSTRPDGFHTIESLFLALEYGDTLFFETVPETGRLLPEIGMDWQLGGAFQPPAAFLTLLPEENLISKAVSLFKSRAGCDFGLKVAVKKRIPPGGGLGGGSSDAAAALLAMNTLALACGFSPEEAGKGNYGLLSRAALCEMGAALGSDVPFFLCGASAAWVSGRGEHVQPLTLPHPVKNLSFVLVNPGFPSDTAGAYDLVDKYRQGSSFGRLPHEAVVDTFTGTPANWPFSNDFYPVFRACAGEKTIFSESGSVYRQIITRLGELGADFAGLSGSGSTCFGVFTEREKAEKARDLLLKQWNFTIVTFPLAY